VRAQGDGARNWQLAPDGTRSFTAFGYYVQGNQSLDPSIVVQGARVDAAVGQLQYVQTFALAGEQVQVFGVLPFGRVKGSVSRPSGTQSTNTSQVSRSVRSASSPSRPASTIRRGRSTSGRTAGRFSSASPSCNISANGCSTRRSLRSSSRRRSCSSPPTTIPRMRLRWSRIRWRSWRATSRATSAPRCGFRSMPCTGAAAKQSWKNRAAQCGRCRRPSPARGCRVCFLGVESPPAHRR